VAGVVETMAIDITINENHAVFLQQEDANMVTNVTLLTRSIREVACAHAIRLATVARIVPWFFFLFLKFRSLPFRSLPPLCG